jgi:DNA-binding LacI/PurR family transcriptional regulator
MHRPPAMSDVAHVAGVSHQTVSRVLNGHPSVREATRERVLAAIVELGYRRNTAARTLVTRRSGTIGVVTLSEPEFGPTSTFIAVESAASEAGYYVSVATLPPAQAEGVSRVLEHFLSQAVEGVIVIAPLASVSDALRPFAEQVPVVTIAAGTPAGQAFHPISVDQVLGARLATRHLIELGHREVVHLAGPQDWLDARERTIGWRSELAAAGLTAGDPIPGDWTAARGYAVGRRLVAEGVPSAVFAANDQLALGLLRAFAEARLSVPLDVSVVGFDDIAGAANFIPPLTTVRQDFLTLGRRSIAMLLSAIAGEDLDHTPIPPSLVVRSSTAPAS